VFSSQTRHSDWGQERLNGMEPAKGGVLSNELQP